MSIAAKIQLKVHGGTKSDTVHLCKTCKNGMTVEGSQMNQHITHCHALSSKVPFRVSECDSYLNKSIPSLYEMEQIAWMLLTKKAGRQIGFVAPSDPQHTSRQHNTPPVD